MIAFSVFGGVGKQRYQARKELITLSSVDCYRLAEGRNGRGSTFLLSDREICQSHTLWSEFLRKRPLRNLRAED